MATRPSGTIFILNSDIEKGVVQKKSFKELVEYWIYTSASPNRIATNGVLMPQSDVIEANFVPTLKYIVVCDDSKENHVTSTHLHNITINGVRFSNDEHGQDLTEYLEKTGRTIC